MLASEPLVYIMQIKLNDTWVQWSCSVKAFQNKI